MLVWFAETTLVAMVLATAATLGSRWTRIGPVARHALWLAVLVKLIAPPVVSWPRPAATPRPDPKGIAATRPTNDSFEPGPTRDDRIRVAISEAWPSPPPDPAVDSPTLVLPAFGRGAIAAWGVASAFLALVQAFRIVRFRRRLRWAVPAPGWIEQEARHVGRRIGVRVPEILVIPASTPPMLWFLGRPKLLLPARLVETLGAGAWRGILAHEMAHVRRRDHWVRRLELVAGLIWWWNPLYWLTRRRLDVEAELACDEWAVRALPEERFAYAEALLEVCRSVTAAGSPMPALGVAGAGRFLERRVTMILHDRAPSRASTPVLLGAGLLALLSLPCWTASAAPAAATIEAFAPARDRGSDASSIVAQDDDDDEKERATEKSAKKAAKSDAAKRATREEDNPASERAKKLGEMGEKLSKELEQKLGPGSEFQKKMEELGPKIEKAMKPLAEKLEAKFGPGSEFEKEITEAFGPGSDFEKEINEAFGPDSDFMKEITKQFGPGSEFEKGMKKLESASAAAKDRKKADKKAVKAEKKFEKKEVAPKAEGAQRQSRAKQIQELQEQIDKLSEKLKALGEAEDGDDDGEDARDR